MEPQNNKYDRVLRMFKHYGCSEQTLMTRPKLLQILNKQAAINLHRKFSPTIIDEMWGQTETNSKGQTTVLTFCKIFSQAMAILEDRIGIIDGPTGIMQKEAQLKVQQNKLKQLETQYQQGFETNYDKINVVRKNITLIEGKIKELKNNRGQFQRDLSEMQGVLDCEERPPTIERSEYIAQSRLEESMSPPAPSPHLSLIFKVTVLAILLQFLFFNFRQSFLAVLCYFFIIYWLFLGYYDQNFVKVIITGLGISCVMDLVFACLQIMGKVGNYQHPQSEKVWMYISTVFIIIQIALRVLLLIKLCLFREPNAKKQYFELFGHEIELNARSGKMFSSQKSFD